MSVSTARTRRPACVPMSTIARASSRPASSVFMNAPAPTFTSSTMVCAPLASFLDMMLLAISGKQATVAVTSRRAYNRPSAGARSLLWPTSARPISRACLRKAASESSPLQPGMLSSLSMVPPVCARPRPLILATVRPSAASIGVRIKLVLSPTPPVECLSTVSLRLLRSNCSPLPAITSVRSATSRASCRAGTPPSARR